MSDGLNLDAIVPKGLWRSTDLETEAVMVDGGPQIQTRAGGSTAAPWVQPAVPTPPAPTAATAAPWTQPVDDWEPAQRSSARAWAVGLVTLLALGVGGYVLVDRLTAEEPAEVAADGAPAAPPSFGAPSDDATPRDGESTESSEREYTVGPVNPLSVTATCQAPPGVDAANNPVTYEPERTLDGRPDTAWRCEGSATGVRLVYELPMPMWITSVGLIPGYAKVDPTDGTDRFLDNYTVTAVEWQFDDGESHPQHIAVPRPALAVSELPEEIYATRVVLEIMGTGNPGAERPFTAISDVAFTGYPAQTE
jgi:hypothetical protein